MADNVLDEIGRLFVEGIRTIFPPPRRITEGCFPQSGEAERLASMIAMPEDDDSMKGTASVGSEPIRVGSKAVNQSKPAQTVPAQQEVADRIQAVFTAGIS